jgi:hypothetical protein
VAGANDPGRAEAFNSTVDFELLRRRCLSSSPRFKWPLRQYCGDYRLARLSQFRGLGERLRWLAVTAVVRRPTNSSSKAKATGNARNPASPNPPTEPAQSDAVAMKKDALGHLLVDPVVAT